MGAKEAIKDIYNKSTQPSTLKAVATFVATVAASVGATVLVQKKLEERATSK